MRKKTRILIAALGVLVVTTASTYAYFTSTTTINANGGAGNPLQLDITNGQVSITGKIGAGGTTPNWSYDVARNSTDGTMLKKYGMADTNVDGSSTVADYANQAAFDADYLSKYVDPNRSPDITGIDTTNDVAYGGVNRRIVGAAVTGAITKARPGDALVMGVAGGNSGLNITNNSNLRVKVKVAISQTAGAQTMIQYLDQAGWAMYVKGIKVNNPLNLASVQTALDALATTLAPGASLSSNIDIRLELPLTTADAYQNTSVGTGGLLTSFDISSLISITATQENNPGWTVSGT